MGDGARSVPGEQVEGGGQDRLTASGGARISGRRCHALSLRDNLTHSRGGGIVLCETRCLRDPDERGRRRQRRIPANQKRGQSWQRNSIPRLRPVHARRAARRGGGGGAPPPAGRRRVGGWAGPWWAPRWRRASARLRSLTQD